MVRGRLPSPLFRPDCGHPYVASLMIGSGLEKKKLNTGEYKKGVAPNSSRHFKRATLRVRAEREGERRKRALAKKGQQTSESVGSEKKGENEAEAEAEAELERAKARSRRWAGVPLVAPVWAGCSYAIVRGLPSRSSTHIICWCYRISTVFLRRTVRVIVPAHETTLVAVARLSHRPQLRLQRWFDFVLDAEKKTSRLFQQQPASKATHRIQCCLCIFISRHLRRQSRDQQSRVALCSTNSTFARAARFLSRSPTQS